MSETTTLRSIDLSDSSAIIDKIYDLLVKAIDTYEITASDVILMTTKTMQLVEQITSLSGIQKKSIVLNTLKKVINNKVKNEQDRDIILDFICLFLPSIIDTLISLDKKEIAIAVKKCRSFFPCK